MNNNLFVSLVLKFTVYLEDVLIDCVIFFFFVGGWKKVEKEKDCLAKITCRSSLLLF